MQGPKGTYDVLPGDQPLRNRIVHRAGRLFSGAGYGRIETPAFEETGLFVRGVGESSDIVRKEMYTFEDKGGRSMTLKPEGTAPVVRSYIQHGMHKLPQPVKLWYYERMYRFERPQAGRYREHYQLGAEAIGSAEPALDAEMIMLLSDLYEELRVPDVILRISSMGCPSCRPDYIDRLQAYLEDVMDELCRDCRERARLNPLRVFDCKQEGCLAKLRDAPKLVDNLCGECMDNFGSVKEFLDDMGRAYRVDGTLVRGFDYYTRTTFEFECGRLGAQKGIGGGGRYDKLVEQLGGPDTPAVGFGTGLERIVLALESAGVGEKARGIDVFFAILDPAAWLLAVRLMHGLRLAGHSVDADYAGRKMKGQMKQADRLGARYAVIIGEQELATGEPAVKDMQSGEQQPVDADMLESYLGKKLKSGKGS